MIWFWTVVSFIAGTRALWSNYIAASQLSESLRKQMYNHAKIMVQFSIAAAILAVAFK